MMKRFLSLDILKLFAICVVCSCHFIYYNESALDNFVAILACTGVPLFFMVNGALLMNKLMDFKKHIKKTVVLFTVLMCWKVITPLVQWCALRPDMSVYGKTTIIQYFFGEDLSGFFVGHFWFMNALISIYLIFPILKKCDEDENGRTYLKYLMLIIFFFSFVLMDLKSMVDIVSAFTGLKALSFSGLNVYYIFSGYAYCVFYFCLGSVLFRYTELGKKKINIWIPFVMIAIGWGWIFVLNRFQNTYTNAQWIVINGYERIGTLLLSAGIFIFVCQYAEKISNELLKKCISIVADNTMGIYYVHIIIGTYFMVFCEKYLPGRGIWVNTGKTIFFVTASLCVSLIARKIPLLNKLFK